MLRIKSDKLTEKQRKWIKYYKQGKTAAEAVELAGYNVKDHHSAENIGSKNLSKLGEYIVDREELLAAEDIADIAEINRFWTCTMRNATLDIKDRIKASELRARAAGAFVERKTVDINGGSVVFISGEDELSE